MSDSDASTAYRSGYDDGESRVTDPTWAGEELDAETVESWFGPGQVEPDEALLNAIVSDAGRATALGILLEQVESQGPDWVRALADYNRGFRAGARAAIKAE